jgi:galactokinase/mevalonate kinase-like predicted kinase
MAESFESLESRPRPQWFAGSDPADRKLGSGGGTAHLLVSAWKATGGGLGFWDWLRRDRKLMIHGGGQSRRLPAYAVMGKPLMPIPVFRWARGQRLDQTLLDLQLPGYQRVLRAAPAGTVSMVTSGDVLLRYGQVLPEFPSVDVLGLGMWVTPEKARDFGVFFAPRRSPNVIAFFLQKPTAARIRELATDYLPLVDTGMWLLSERAVRVLLRKSGWDEEACEFKGGAAGHYELYSGFGLALGTHPYAPDPEVSALTCAVVPLPQPEFYHFGTSRQVIESVSALQNLELDEMKLGVMGARRHPDQYLQNSRFEFPLRREQNHTLWVENSVVPATWRLAHSHVLTGVPANAWDLTLEAGVCLDFVPVGQTAFGVRPYGINDAFSGAVGDPATRWFDRPAQNWFFARGVEFQAAGIDASQDLQDAPLFPVLEPENLDPRFLEWMFAARPVAQEGWRDLWIRARRLSANQLGAQANLHRLHDHRERNRRACLPAMVRNHRWSVFFKLDLESTAAMFARGPAPLPPESGHASDLEPMQQVHEQMFRSAVLRHRSEPGWESHQANAFGRLRELMVSDAQLKPVNPAKNVLDDQIVWGRCPVRLDLAGGWTDTPPYCLEHGGKVINVAVDLNGQPPIQVFAKLTEKLELVVRSIDQGTEEHITSFEGLDTFARPGSEFALAKAGLALAGFLPRFNADGGFRSLQEQLQTFGGGIELSLLSAVPKGSGLGTSSILAATLLATLGDLCGLGWDKTVLFTRTLVLEQMLTTGGGWQDQAGGIFRGVKSIETSAGLTQQPTLRWLPEHLLDQDNANRNILLYYTGITRLAKNILQEIVRGIFLNSPTHLDVVRDIGLNAETAFQAIQRSDRAGLVESIRRSWTLNQRLDAGTNPPAVAGVLDRIKDWTEAAKLLGAGGGGYLLIFAKDEAAARAIRQELSSRPPNRGARFVDFALSPTGLQLTRS